MTKQGKQLLLLILFIAAIVALRYSSAGNVLTFENLKQHRDILTALVQDHYGPSVTLFVVVYILAAAFSVPGAVILTLGGGFLFGTVAATVYVNIGATAGASLAFLSARYLLGDRLQEKYQSPLNTFNAEIAKNGARYLLTLRFIPVFPFFLINFLSGLTKLPLKTFVWTTSLGIIPGTAVFAFAGRQIGTINSPSEILSKKTIIAFIILALFALFPVIVDRIKGARKQTGA
jgi:uncharacterized membrane protein YdjX (TVP38/TMEM64 family)